jgi:DNA-binding transcriptional regulator YdaS (Cro superfamily)
MTKKQTGLQLAIEFAGGKKHFAHSIGARTPRVDAWLAADQATPPPDSAVLKAITAAGGPTALARALGVTYQSIDDWRRKGCVPLARAKEIEMQFGIDRNSLVSPKVRSSMGVGGEL